MLRLANSDDVRPTVADHERGYRFVERALEAETGESVDSMVREIWPNPGLADVIAGWMDRFEPDVVSLKASSFWFSYPSVPLRLRRSSLGRTGRGMARVGFGAAQVPWVAHSDAYRVLRDTVRRIIGGVPYFTAAQVIDRISACLRRIVQREGVLLVVRGPLVAETGGCTSAVQHRFEIQRREVDRALAALCAQLHVHYTGCREAPHIRDLLRYRGPDRLHLNAAGHQRVGLEEAEAMVSAWRHAHGASVPLYLESAAVS
jgi:hypothetical protein